MSPSPALSPGPISTLIRRGRQASSKIASLNRDAGGSRSSTSMTRTASTSALRFIPSKTFSMARRSTCSSTRSAATSAATSITTPATSSSNAWTMSDSSTFITIASRCSTSRTPSSTRPRSRASLEATKAGSNAPGATARSATARSISRRSSPSSQLMISPAGRYTNGKIPCSTRRPPRARAQSLSPTTSLKSPTAISATIWRRASIARPTSSSSASKASAMVHATAVEGLASGRLRVGMIGGGRNAFIGAVHRMAMRLDDLIDLKAGALSSDAENARASGAELGLAPDRTYSDYREMAAREAARPDGIEAAVIVTPNHLHYPVAKAFLDAGIDVICDKPLSTTLAEATELVELTRAKGLIFAVTLNNTGYPMVRQAREMIEGGAIGDIRVVHAAYVQDWLTLPIEADGHKQAEWRTDPERAGASACLADIGVHAHSLALFVTGLELEAVSADLATFVPGRRLDDNAHVLMRFQGGARGVLASSQVAVGNLNNLSLKVYGSRAGLEWAGEEPETLRFTPYGEPSRLLRRGGPGNTPLAVEGSRMPGGHTEGYVEGFANLYRGAAELISARRAGRAPGRSAKLTPNVLDGARGVAFIEAAVKSSRSNGVWTSAGLG